MPGQPYKAELGLQDALQAEEAFDLWRERSSALGIVPVLCICVGGKGGVFSQHILPGGPEVDLAMMERVLRQVLASITSGSVVDVGPDGAEE